MHLFLWVLAAVDLSVPFSMMRASKYSHKFLPTSQRTGAQSEAPWSKSVGQNIGFLFALKWDRVDPQNKKAKPYLLLLDKINKFLFSVTSSLSCWDLKRFYVLHLSCILHSNIQCVLKCSTKEERLRITVPKIILACFMLDKYPDSHMLFGIAFFDQHWASRHPINY